MEFEVRLIAGAVAVIGEEVTFKEKDGKLLALNEDGEAFGVVPNTYAEQLIELAKQNSNMNAFVIAHGDGVSTIRITGVTSETVQSNTFQPVATTQFVEATFSPKEKVQVEASSEVATSPSKESKEKQNPPSPKSEESKSSEDSKSSSGFMEGCAGCLTVALLLFFLYVIMMAVIFS